MVQLKLQVKIILYFGFRNFDPIAIGFGFVYESPEDGKSGSPKDPADEEL